MLDWWLGLGLELELGGLTRFERRRTLGQAREGRCCWRWCFGW